MIVALSAAVLATLASLPIAQPLPAGQRYHLSLLPVPEGCDSTVFFGHGLSGTGAAIGNLTCGDSFVYRAIVWTGETAVELESLGGPSSYPLGISRDGGTIVGMADTAETLPDGTYVSRPVAWKGALPVDLQTLGGPSGAAADVSARGIVGVCQPGYVDPRVDREPFRACLWKGNTIRDLGDLGGPEALAFDVNSRGWVVGWSNTDTSTSTGNAFANNAFLHDGVRMRSLGTLGGATSEAWGLNERGEVVGYSETDILDPRGRLERHAFRWRRGVLEDLGTLGGGGSQAWAINDRGDIVGASLLVDDRGRLRLVAALWRGGAIVNLHDVVDDLQGWTLTRATAIDNTGRILVQAERVGESRVGILLPRGGKRHTAEFGITQD